VLVEFGNRAGLNADGSEVDVDGPIVSYLHVPDSYSMDRKTMPTVSQFKAHLGTALVERDGITRLPDHERLLVATHPGGMWRRHSAEDPSWVWSDDALFQKWLAEYYNCPAGKPADVEDTHHTRFGPPGVGAWNAPVTGLLVNSGLTILANMIGGGQVGTSGTATASSSTSLTNSGASWTTNQWAGYRVYCPAAGVWGLILSNTATVLTVDRWYAVATPGGAAGSTPAATAIYIIADGGAPSAWFMGLTANSSAAAAGDTQLTGEITTASGGLVRKICPFAYSGGGATTLTLTPVFTANGSDSLPVTIAKIGVFNAMVVANTISMFFETLLGTSATLSASGDQLTITETVTI
jgi:hypothetical protein